MNATFRAGYSLVYCSGINPKVEEGHLIYEHRGTRLRGRGCV